MSANPFDEIMEQLQEINARLKRMEKTNIIPLETSPAEIITRSQLAKKLNVSTTTILRWQQKGKIPYKQVGFSFRYCLDDVLSAISKKQTK